MSLRSFLKLVEIQTKLASMIPFLLGTFYVLYRFNTFKLLNFLLMLISLLCVDMATTAVNNYKDYKRANKRHGYGYEKHNVIVRDNLKESTVLMVIFVLYAIAIIFGILLFLHTDIVVLLLGIFSFMIGVLYSCGPVPISRTPFGEIFSGGVMGFIIPFLSVYIHIFDKNIIVFTWQEGFLSFQFNITEILYIILVSIPSVIGIANIMLANNICDMEDDIENKRYTLPIYIGKNTSLMIFKILYYICYILLIIMLALRVIPWISAITLITFFIVSKNIKMFYEKQTKKDTFVVAVKNFVIINSVLAFTLAVEVVIKHL